MAIITLSGEPGCRTGEVGRLAAQRLGYEHINAARLESLLDEEFGAEERTEKLWPLMASSVLLRLGVKSHLVVGVDGAERLFPHHQGLLRVRVVAPENRRIGNLMLDERLERAAARQQVKERERAIRGVRKHRFNRATPSPDDFDLTVNSENLDGAHIAELIQLAAEARQLTEHGYVAPAAEAQQQFRIRLQLAGHGILPKGEASLERAKFGHPSEQTFANLLDFYRIAWEYEPKSFPIAWDENGKVLESFTPDFFLPESNLYVELTTMKQSLVTKKNRKIRLLREIYPQVNVQVFYQKDLQDLIFKYGLVPTPAAETA